MSVQKESCFDSDNKREVSQEHEIKEQSSQEFLADIQTPEIIEKFETPQIQTGQNSTLIQGSVGSVKKQ